MMQSFTKDAMQERWWTLEDEKEDVGKPPEVLSQLKQNVDDGALSVPDLFKSSFDSSSKQVKNAWESLTDTVKYGLW